MWMSSGGWDTATHFKTLNAIDEMSWGLDASLELEKHVALVLDIHHHWVRTGEYILPTDRRFDRVIESWRGVRPVIHYSVSREDLLTEWPNNELPDMEYLLMQGYKKAKLRAHSDFMWNSAVNDWALSFNDRADIMVESKAKNLASIRLHDYGLNTVCDLDNSQIVKEHAQELVSVKA